MFKPKVRYVARPDSWQNFDDFKIVHASNQLERAISGIIRSKTSAKRIAAALNLYEAYRHGECDIKGVDVYNTIAS